MPTRTEAHQLKKNQKKTQVEQDANLRFPVNYNESMFYSNFVCNLVSVFIEHYFTPNFKSVFYNQNSFFFAAAYN